VTADTAAGADESRRRRAKRGVGEARTDYAIVIIRSMAHAVSAIEQTFAAAASPCPLQRRNDSRFIVSSTDAAKCGRIAAQFERSRPRARP
jgi:hypothetical protein